MKVDLSLDGIWQQNNNLLRDKLKINPLSTVRIQPGISHALSEAVRGLVRLFPHRKSYALVKGSGPYYDEIVEFLSMEGLLKSEFSVTDLLKPDECIAKIPKDCLFILGSYDDPMTGELFNIESLYETLHKNRTFTITLSHNYHCVRGFPTVNQYMVVISKFRSLGTISLLGQRASKIPSMTLGSPDWFSSRDWTPQLILQSESKSQVEDFERRLPVEFVPFFDSREKRLFDRAVIRAKDFDGEACIQLLAKELGQRLAPPGQDEALETLSLCRWNGINTFNWYKDQHRNLRDLRGVIILDLKLVNPQTRKALEKVAQSLKSLQQ